MFRFNVDKTEADVWNCLTDNDLKYRYNLADGDGKMECVTCQSFATLQ